MESDPLINEQANAVHLAFRNTGSQTALPVIACDEDEDLAPVISRTQMAEEKSTVSIVDTYIERNQLIGIFDSPFEGQIRRILPTPVLDL
jgi:hypothetical protein